MSMGSSKRHMFLERASLPIEFIAFMSLKLATGADSSRLSNWYSESIVFILQLLTRGVYAVKCVLLLHEQQQKRKVSIYISELFINLLYENFSYSFFFLAVLATF